ncbi:MAG: tetratricopeptide repeat protein [Actinomycetota bacterium]|jgi:predicted Zn-dependent protease|nr:tetratricopeptide repeat protein [Actinomycetota bacterium]MDQ3428601.1 tetratricopeptide repeat protein [Actinomycetota bacterium]
METPRSEMFRKLLQRDEKNPMVLYSLGNELFKEGNHAEARDHLKRAVEQKPDYSVAYRTLGRAHFELGEDAEARRVFDEGRQVAEANGDLQTAKEIEVFKRRLEKRGAGEGP